MTTDKKLNEAEIDISKLIRIYWRNKFLVILLSASFMVIGHLYSKTFDVSTEYTSVVEIRYPGPVLFIDYYNILRNQNITLNQEYIDEFNLNLKSKDLLVQFAKQSKNMESFKSYLSEQNTSLTSYLNNKFFKSGEKAPNGYGLIYHESLNGNEFLNDYINYVRVISINEIKSRIEEKLNKQIIELERHLEIAKAIDLDKSLIQSMTNKESNIFFTYPPEENYYKGKIILEEEIKNLFNKKIALKQNDFYYNPILDRASITESITNNYRIYTFVGLTTGFILSTLIILFKRKKIK